jgi:hypothetical protein
MLGGSSAKKAASAIKRANNDNNDRNMIAQQGIHYALKPYADAGANSVNLLQDYLGTSSPKGYAPKPTREDVANEFSATHYAKYGRGYSAGDSNMGAENGNIDKVYQQRLQAWQAGLDQYQAEHPNENANNPIYGSLLKPFTNADFEKDPGYQFRMDEGNKGIDRAAAARGGYDSGSTLKALARYNQDYASNEFGNAATRNSNNKNQIYSFLSGTSNAGQGAVGTEAGLIAGMTNNQNSNNANSANQVGQLGMQGASAMNNAIQGGIGNYLYSQRTNQPVTGMPNGGYGQVGGYSTAQPSGTPWYLS